MIAFLATGLFEGVRAAQEAEVIERWHEFYLLAGTAAVTLVGLLFVSLSFHLEAFLHESRAALLAHARETLLSFVYVLILSLVFLVPGEGVRPLGLTILAMSVTMLVITGASALRARRHGPSEHLRFLDRRRQTLVIGYVAASAIGVVILARRDPYAAYWMIGVVCLLLGNAAGAAWDLLVQVGRHKQAQDRDRAAR